MKSLRLLSMGLLMFMFVFSSCSKDDDADKVSSVKGGEGTWINPYKIGLGATKHEVSANSTIYEFEYELGASYTLSLESFTTDLDMYLVRGSGSNMGSDYTNSTNPDLEAEEITFSFKEQDILIGINNDLVQKTSFVLNITKN